MDVESLPIDIHYNKLLDWLIDRRHCDLRWHHQLQELKPKIRASLLSLPKNEDTISRIFNKEDVTYTDCTDIMEYLCTVESKEKNFLGQYTSQALKEWDDILRSYEKKNLHLAEGAQVMSRLVNYGIASLKRQITRCQQQQKDSARKANDSQTNARALRVKFEEECQALGIEGKDVYNELTQLLTTQLPVLYSEVESLAVHVESALLYYQAFRHCTIVPRSESPVLSLLSFFIKNGNVTVYQWKNGTPPPLPIDTDQIRSQNDKLANALGIWDECYQLIKTQTNKCLNVSTFVTFLEDTITVQEESSPGDSKEVLEIDWGNLGGVEEEGGGEDASGDIDFGDGDIDYDVLVDIDVDLAGITVEDGGDSCAALSQYPTILEDFNTRNMLLDDLMELSEFTKQRIIDMNPNETGGGGGLVLQVDLPSSVQGYSSQDMQDMLCNVSAVIDKLTNKKSQQLLLMLGSQSYLERLSSQLKRQQELSQRASSLINEYTYKIKEASEEQTQHEESLSLLVRDIKKIKNMVAKEISKKYDSRTVNITGDINQLF